MEWNLDTILNMLTLLLGGGGIGGFITWRYVKKKAQAEAVSAEAQATHEVQDVYQQLISDVKQDRDEQKSYIRELKDDRANLRADRDELRKRQDELEESVRGLKMEVARNGRQVEMMRPFLCGRVNCADRTPVAEDKPTRKRKERKKEIEPINASDL